MRKCYRDKHDMMLELLKPFEKRFIVSGENAGLHLLLTYKEGAEEDLIKRAMLQGVKVYGLSENYVGEVEEKKQSTIILGYGGLSKQEIEEGMEALRKAWF